MRRFIPSLSINFLGGKPTRGVEISVYLIWAGFRLRLRHPHYGSPVIFNIKHRSPGGIEDFYGNTWKRHDFYLGRRFAHERH